LRTLPPPVHQKGQPNGLEPRGRQNVAGFNANEFAFWIAGSGAYAAMLYSFARVGAVLKLKVNDYYHGPRRWLRLHEKGGKEHEMPVHHLLEEALKAYIAVPQASKADNSYSKA
jgi:hypothetical protein